MPILLLALASITACTPRSICSWLLGRIALEHRQLDVERLAPCSSSARRSFGRHEPPKAKPGFR